MIYDVSEDKLWTEMTNILPYFALGAASLFFYIPFCKKIGPVRRCMFLSAGVFLFGVVIIESFEGWLFSNSLASSLTCIFLEALEEILEMSGVVIFIYALLEHIRKNKN